MCACRGGGPWRVSLCCALASHSLVRATQRGLQGPLDTAAHLGHTDTWTWLQIPWSCGHGCRPHGHTDTSADSHSHVDTAADTMVTWTRLQTPRSRGHGCRPHGHGHCEHSQGGQCVHTCAVGCALGACTAGWRGKGSAQQRGPAGSCSLGGREALPPALLPALALCSKPASATSALERKVRNKDPG